MKTIVIDIETVPRGEYSPAEYNEEIPLIENTSPSKAIKDSVKQEAYVAKKFESEITKYNKDHDKFMDADMQAWKKRSLNDKTCQVISIAVKTMDKSVQVFAGPDEHENLIGFMCWLDDLDVAFKDILWLGHNIIGFDFPILKSKIMSQYWHYDTQYQELAQMFLREPYFLPDWATKYPHKFIPWKKKQEVPPVFDFMHHLPAVTASFTDSEGKTRNGTSLDIILRHWGLKGKEGCDGSDVYSLWCDGDIETITEYNKDEVEQMEQLFLRYIGWW